MSVLLAVGPAILTRQVERPFQGAAPKSDLTSSEQGWEVQIDLLGLDPAWRTTLDELLGTPVPAGSTENRIWKVAKNEAPEQVPVLLPSSSTPVPQGFRASGAFRKGPIEFTAELDQTPASVRIWAGPVRARLPEGLLVTSAHSVAPDLLRQVPADSQASLWLNLDRFSFTQESIARLRKEWTRWEPEMPGVPTELVGPEVAYSYWRGRSYLMSTTRNSTRFRTFLQNRFPARMLPVLNLRRFGTIMTGFQNEGPAWLFHRDAWYGAPESGFESLSELRGYQTGLAGRGRWGPPTPFLIEVRQQLNARPTWDLFLMSSRPNQSYSWAVGLAWSSPSQGTGEGFLVLEAKGQRHLKSER